MIWTLVFALVQKESYAEIMNKESYSKIYEDVITLKPILQFAVYTKHDLLQNLSHEYAQKCQIYDLCRNMKYGLSNSHAKKLQ